MDHWVVVGAGGAGTITIDGTSANDLLIANPTATEANVFTGGGGNDVMIADAAQDTFVFAQGAGHDTVMGFTHGDFLQFDDTLFATADDVLQAASGSVNAVISFADGAVTLWGVDAATLQVADIHINHPLVN